MTTAIRPLVKTNSGVIDRRIFNNKDIYQQELEQVFGRCWLFIGHDSLVANNNDFQANYMGEDPILLTRDSKGKLHAFLNMCRHRGNRICRADYGSAPSFMCTYHGWTFATDGKLVGVPGYKEAYFEELDRSQWGLVEVGQIDTYKGVVFATWDKSAPPLLDFLGDMTWYLDDFLDRRAGGTEFIRGIQRYVIPANWKFGADNFGGDGYHTYLTHGSMRVVRGNQRANFYGQGGWSVTPGNGHGIVRVSDPSNAGNAGGGGTLTQDSGNPATRYRSEVRNEARQRLGSVRVDQGVGTMTIFPNFSKHVFVRNWHPRGPDKTEVWSYHLVDKDAPKEVKDALRRAHVFSMGPSGNTEQDDMNNFIQCTQSAKGVMGPKYEMNLALGLGHDLKREEFPGMLNACPSEQNQRAFYDFWAQLMDAPSWSQVKLTPRTVK